MAMAGELCGDGEGMIAVVRGLPNANLAVTLLDGRHQYTLQPDLQPAKPKHNFSTSTHTPTVEVSTEVPNLRQRCNMCKDTGAQVTDGRYTSSYQVSHCRVKPTSPVDVLTEFPPQRAELCRGHGNFEIGGYGSGERAHVSVKLHNGNYRGAMVWPDRGSVYVPRPSREIDSFANSLRRYPNMSPDRSTDIVERLITYTQSKNYSTRDSVHSRSSRLKSTREPVENINAVIEELRNMRNTMASKNQQTYTRSRQFGNVHESPTRDSPTPCIIKSKARMSRNPDRICDRVERPMSPNYDYLNASANINVDRMEKALLKKGYCKNMDVRYLCDMTKSIRDRIKHICDETPSHNICQPTGTCSKMRERWSQHIRDHHPKNEIYAGIHNGTQVEPNSISKGVGVDRYSEPFRPTGVDCASPTSHCTMCKKKLTYGKSYAGQTRPLGLLAASSVQTSLSSRGKTSDSCISFNDNVNQAQRCTYPPGENSFQRSKSEELQPKSYSYDNKLANEVNDWLSALPEFRNEGRNEKKEREYIIKSLVEKLQQMTENGESQNQMRFEIERSIKALPMWSLGQCMEQATVVENISDDLLGRLKNITRSKSHGFNNSPLLIERSELRSNCCGAGSADAYAAEISVWVNELPFKGRDSTICLRNEITNDLMTLLKPISLTRPNCKYKYKEVLVENISKFLCYQPIHICGCKKIEKIRQLAEKLADRLLNIELPNAKPAFCCTPKEPGVASGADLEKSVKSQVADVLNESHVSEDPDEVTKTTNDVSSYLLQSIEAVRAGNDDTVNEISHIVQEDAHTSKNRADTIAATIVDKVRDMPVIHERRKLSMIPAESSLRLGGQQKGNVRASTPIRDYDTSLDKIPSFYTISNHNNISAIASPKTPRRNSYEGKLKDQISYWLYEMPIDLDTSESRDELIKSVMNIVKNKQPDDTLKKEIMQWLGKMLKSSDHREHIPEMSDKLITRLKTLITGTSQNQQARQAMESSNLTGINKAFADSVRNQIRNWVTDLPIDLKDSKDMIVNQLTTEIVERQSYLQNNPNKRQSEDEEDRYLEYHIYKCLYKIPPSILAPADVSGKLGPNVNDLITKMNKLRNDMFPGVEKIENDISEWFQKLPKGVNTIGNADFKQKMTKELASAVDQKKNEPEAKEQIEREAEEWVKKVVKIPKEQALINDIVNSLKTIVTKPLNEVSPQDPDNILSQAISDWCHELPIQINAAEGQDREGILLDLLFKLFRKANAIVSDPEVVRTDAELVNELSIGIKELLDRLPSSPELEKVKQPMSIKLAKKITEYKDYFKSSKPTVSQDPNASTSDQSGLKNKLQDDVIAWCHHLATFVPEIPREQLIHCQSELICGIFAKMFELAEQQLTDDRKLFQDLMSEEIERLIDKYPKNPNLEAQKHVLALAVTGTLYKHRHLFLEEQSPVDAINTSQRYTTPQRPNHDGSCMQQQLSQRQDVRGVNSNEFPAQQAPLFQQIPRSGNAQQFVDCSGTEYSPLQIPTSGNLISSQFIPQNNYAITPDYQQLNVPPNQSANRSGNYVCSQSQNIDDIRSEYPQSNVPSNQFVNRPGNYVYPQSQNNVEMRTDYSQMNVPPNQSANRSGNFVYSQSQNNDGIRSEYPQTNIPNQSANISGNYVCSDASRQQLNRHSTFPGIGNGPGNENQYRSLQMPNVNAAPNSCINQAPPILSQQSLRPGSAQDFSNRNRAEQESSRHYTTLPTMSTMGSPQPICPANRCQQSSSIPLDQRSFIPGVQGNMSYRPGIQDNVSFRPRSDSHSKKLLSQEIVQWCNQLPVEEEHKEELQLNLLYRIFRKAHETAANMDIFNDNNLFEDIMLDSIETLLDDYSSNPEIQRNKRKYAIDLAKKICNYKNCFLPSGRNKTLSPEDQMLLQQINEGNVATECRPMYNEVPEYETFERQIPTGRGQLPFSSSPCQQRPIDNRRESGSRRQWPTDVQPTMGSPKYISCGQRPPGQDEMHYTSMYSTNVGVQEQQQSMAPMQRLAVPNAPGYEYFAGNVPAASSQRAGGVCMQNRFVDSCRQDCTGVSNSQQPPVQSTSRSIQAPPQQSQMELHESQEPGPSGVQMNKKASSTSKNRSRPGTPNQSNQDSNGSGSSNRARSKEAGAKQGKAHKDNSQGKQRSVAGNVRGNSFTDAEQYPPNNSYARPDAMAPDMGQRQTGRGLDEEREMNGREFRLRCHCQDLIADCEGGQRSVGVCLKPSCISNVNNAMTQCPRCCGVHCPFPSFLYFRQ